MSSRYYPVERQIDIRRSGEPHGTGSGALVPHDSGPKPGDDDYGKVRTHFESEMRRVESEMARLRRDFESYHNSYHQQGGPPQQQPPLKQQQPIAPSASFHRRPGPPAQKALMHHPVNTSGTLGSRGTSTGMSPQDQHRQQYYAERHQPVPNYRSEFFSSGPTTGSLSPKRPYQHESSLVVPSSVNNGAIQQQQPAANTGASSGILNLSDSRRLRLRFDVSGYKPEAVSVKTVDGNRLVVHAVHEERSRARSVYREYNQEFLLPRGMDPASIVSSLSVDGILSVEAPIEAGPGGAYGPPAIGPPGPSRSIEHFPTSDRGSFRGGRGDGSTYGATSSYSRYN